MAARLDYPVRRARDWADWQKTTPMERLTSRWRTWRLAARARRLARPSLTPVGREPRPAGPDDVVLLCIAKNAIKHLPSLLAHHRAMGVRRFAFVDDRSDDGSRAFLAAQHDVDLYESDVGFRQAAGGLVWRDMLVERYGRNRWYLSIDSDEYLVFPGCETRPLAAFVADLARHNLARAHAVMLDIYPDSSLGAAPAPPDPATFPAEPSPLFDGAGYHAAHERFGAAVRGGPRLRLFGADMRMSKFPLVFADRATRFAGGSHHGPLPLQRNFLPVHAVLLHHKYPAGAVEDFRAIAERGTHAKGSGFYKRIVAQPGFNAGADLRYSGSRRFQGSEAMVAEGFMQDLRRENR